MAQRIFVLHTLREGVSPEQYETWLRTENMPIARRLDGVRSVSITRVSRDLMGDGTPPYEYVETLEVDDMAAYLATLGDPELERQSQEFARYVDEVVAFYGPDVEDEPRAVEPARRRPA